MRRQITNTINMSKKTPVLSIALLLAATSSLLAGVSSIPSTTAAGPVSSATSTVGDMIRPCLCHGAFAGAANKPLAFNLTVGYDSSYFCRGLEIGDDLVHATATVDYRPAEWVTLTSSFRYQDVTDADFSEIQAYAGVFFNVGNLSIGPSFRYYQFRPDGGEMDAYDLGIQALYKLGPVNLTGGYFYETESEGSYYEFGVSTVIPVHERVSLVPSAQISYTDGWLMPMLDGLNIVDLRLSVPIKVTEHVHLTPYIGGIFPLEALKDAQENKLVGGISLSITF